MKISILTIIILFFVLTISVHAEVGLRGLTNVIAETLKVKNPFEPQLPRKQVEPPVEKIKPEPPPKPQKPDLTKKSKEEAEIIPPNLSISALIFDSDRPQAIINSKIVDIGDIISDAEIVAINKAGIDIIYQDKLFTIKPRSN